MAVRVALAEARVVAETKADLERQGVTVSKLDEAAAAAGHGDKQVGGKALQCSAMLLIQCRLSGQ